MKTVNIQHPTKTVVQLAVGLAWGNDGALYQQKLDGVFATREVTGGILAGELMADGRFIAWDCVRYHNEDTRPRSAVARWGALRELCAANSLPVVSSSRDGGALLRSVLAAGGEGVVRKLPHATYFDPMEACKRVQTWRCVVTGRGNGQSVFIRDFETGEKRGAVALRGGKCDQIVEGSIIKVEGLELTAEGFIRDARPCKDTPTSWLIKK